MCSCEDHTPALGLILCHHVPGVLLGLPECRPLTFPSVFPGKCATAHLRDKKLSPWEESFWGAGPPSTCYVSPPRPGPPHQLWGWGCCESSGGRQGLAVCILYQGVPGGLLSQLRTWPRSTSPQRSGLSKQGQDGCSREQGAEESGPWFSGVLGAPEDPRLPVLDGGVFNVRNVREQSVWPKQQGCPGPEDGERPTGAVGAVGTLNCHPTPGLA